jgi:hypothetical protein
LIRVVSKNLGWWQQWIEKIMDRIVIFRIYRVSSRVFSALREIRIASEPLAGTAITWTANGAVIASKSRKVE